MGSKESPIRAARRRLGLSRDELGRRLGVSGRAVSYWESGEKLPGPGRTGALRDVLGLSEADLWRHAKMPIPERRKPW